MRSGSGRGRTRVQVQPSAPAARLRPLSPATRVLTGPGRWQPLLAALLVTALWWVGARAVEPVLLPGAWQLQVLAVTASALVVPGVVRSLWPSRPALGVAAGLASAVCVLLVVLGWSRAAVWWQDPVGTARLVGRDLATGVPPLEVSEVLGSGVLIICLLLSWACALVSAGGADVVGLTGLVPATALLVPVVVRGQDPPRLCLVGAALCLTALVVTSAPARYWPSRSHDPGASHGPSAARRRLALAMGAVAVVVATALTGTVPVVTGQGWAPARTRTTEPELSLALSRDLLRGPGTTVLSYAGDLEAGTSLRLPLAVIADLEGTSWGPEHSPGPTQVSRLQGSSGEGALTAGGAVTRSGLSASDLGDLVGAADGEGAGGVTALHVRVQDLSTDHLPVLQSTALVAAAGEGLGTGVEGSTGEQGGAASPPPTGAGADPEADVEADVEADGEADPQVALEAWRWVEGTSTATSGGTPLGPGTTYTLLGWNAVADASGHPVAQAPVTSTASRDVLERYTRLPEDTPDVATQAAREAVAQAGAGEDTASRAAALTSWLRGEGFVYDESAPGGAGEDSEDSDDSDEGSAMDTVTTFLRERRGYCVHYASAFTVMARSLGLPTRIAVGYASAAAGPGRWTDVRGDQLHAWPEVWVEEEGWVAFEPTPGGSGLEADQQQGQDAAPAPATSSPAASTPGQPASQPGTQPPAAEAQDVSDVSEPQAGERAQATSAVRGSAAVVLLACLLAPGLLRAAAGRRRRQRVRSGQDPAAAAWEELVALGTDLRLLGRVPQVRARTHEAVAEQLVAALPPPARQGEDADPAAEDLLRQARDAVHHLASGAVAERYGPPARREAGPGPGATGRREADEGLSAASAGLRSAAGRWRRLLAVVLPASLLPTPAVTRSVSRLYRRRGAVSPGHRGGDADRRAAPGRESPEHVRGRERME